MWEQVYLETVGGAPQFVPGCWGSWLQPNLALVGYAWDFELHSRHTRKVRKAGEDRGRTGPRTVIGRTRKGGHSLEKGVLRGGEKWDRLKTLGI